MDQIPQAYQRACTRRPYTSNHSPVTDSLKRLDVPMVMRLPERGAKDIEKRLAYAVKHVVRTPETGFTGVVVEATES